MDTLFFTDEHTMLVEMVRDFADNEITPVARVHIRDLIGTRAAL